MLDVPKPVYETISYVWGDKAKRGTVYLHGHIRDVPASSEAVLRRMRFPKQKRVLWIDSICINQENLRERSQQVAFMNEIYGSGSRNLIWLGEDDGYTEQALSDIRRVVEDMRVETNDFKDAETVLYDKDGYWFYSDTQLGVKIDDWPALEQFYSNPWFSRLWIVQEAALSLENVCFRGSFEFQLQDILRAGLWLWYKHTRIEFPFAELIRAETIATFADRKCGRYNLFSKSRIRFYSLLSRLLDYEALDPKDHVYGILGLLQRYTDTKEIPATLLPNYEAPLADVFREATRFAITESGDLTALYELYHRAEDGNSEWPTWVPRWDRKFDFEEDAAVFGSRDFKANNDIWLNLLLLEVDDPNILPVEGFVVDSITDLSPVIRILSRKKTSAEEEFMKLIEPAYAMTSRVNGHRTTDQSNRAIACTLVASVGIHRVRMDENECATLYEAYRQYIETSNIPPWIPELSNASSELEIRASEYRQAMFGACDCRRLFSTASGFFGLGPQTMKPGDILAILYGSLLPFVLRPSRDSRGATHELVGSCYVHGIMDGEAVQAHRSQGKEDEIFYLR